ncbi:hypothetical protein AAC387_Pa06g0811 [Persea americana]
MPERAIRLILSSGTIFLLRCLLHQQRPAETGPLRSSSAIVFFWRSSPIGSIIRMGTEECHAAFLFGFQLASIALLDMADLLRSSNCASSLSMACKTPLIFATNDLQWNLQMKDSFNSVSKQRHHLFDF